MEAIENEANGVHAGIVARGEGRGERGGKVGRMNAEG
jgi:hypothetical protein